MLECASLMLIRLVSSSSSVLQFFAVLTLLIVRCLVWMRVRRTSEFDDSDDGDAYATHSSAPFAAAGFGAAERVGDGGSAMYGTGSANFSSKRYSAV